MTAHGEQNPLAGHYAAESVRIMVGVILNPSRLSWRDPEPKPLDERGLLALQRELELSLDLVSEKLREARLRPDPERC